mmetsp:Transcript_20675/g.64868  ORF Transcript_20675/g.64868 Transcript_20675/m.64868 type:complete len:628 (+) Transcript_20675:71-1954(+)
MRLQVSLGFRPRLSPPPRRHQALPRCCCHNMAVLRATVTPRRARRRARSRRSDTNGAARSSTAAAAVATGTVHLAPPAPTSAERRSGAGAAAAAAPDSHLSANGTHAPPHAARSGPSARPAKHSPDPLGPEHHPHAVSAVHSLHPPAAAKHGSATLGAAWTSSRAHVTRSLPPDARSSCSASESTASQYSPGSNGAPGGNDVPADGDAPVAAVPPATIPCIRADQTTASLPRDRRRTPAPASAVTSCSGARHLSTVPESPSSNNGRESAKAPPPHGQPANSRILPSEAEPHVSMEKDVTPGAIKTRKRSSGRPSPSRSRSGGPPIAKPGPVSAPAAPSPSTHPGLACEPPPASATHRGTAAGSPAAGVAGHCTMSPHDSVCAAVARHSAAHAAAGSSIRCHAPPRSAYRPAGSSAAATHPGVEMASAALAPAGSMATSVGEGQPSGSDSSRKRIPPPPNASTAGEDRPRRAIAPLEAPPPLSLPPPPTLPSPPPLPPSPWVPSAVHNGPGSPSRGRSSTASGGGATPSYSASADATSSQSTGGGSPTTSPPPPLPSPPAARSEMVAGTYHSAEEKVTSLGSTVTAASPGPRISSRTVTGALGRHVRASRSGAASHAPRRRRSTCPGA